MAPIIQPPKELVDKTIENDEQQQKQQVSTKLDDSMISLNDMLLSDAWLESDEYDRIFGIRLNEGGQYVMSEKKVVIDEEKETIQERTLKKYSFTKVLKVILL